MADLTLIVEDGTGVADANSYTATVDEASDLIDLHHPQSKDWQEGEEVDRLRALIAAFGIFMQLDWKGQRTTLIQRGPWPRTGATNFYGDTEVGSATIPEQIVIGWALLARRLKQRDQIELADQAAVIGHSNAGRSRTMQGGYPGYRSIIPREIWAWIGPFVNLNTAKLVRAA